MCEEGPDFGVTAGVAYYEYRGPILGSNLTYHCGPGRAMPVQGEYKAVENNTCEIRGTGDAAIPKWKYNAWKKLPECVRK